MVTAVTALSSMKKASAGNLESTSFLKLYLAFVLQKLLLSTYTSEQNLATSDSISRHTMEMFSWITGNLTFIGLCIVILLL